MNRHFYGCCFFKITESPFRNGIFVRVGYAVCFAFSVRSERLIFINRRKSVKLHGSESTKNLHSSSMQIWK